MRARSSGWRCGGSATASRPRTLSRRRSRRSGALRGATGAGRGHGGAWLYTVARNAILDRAPARREPTGEVPDVAVDRSGPARAGRGRLGRLRVHRAFVASSRSERAVLELAYWSGLSQSEVAEFLNIPLGTVKTRTRNGLARLADLLEEDLDEPRPRGTGRRRRAAEDLARMQRAHELLVAVGPPPELTPELEHAPAGRSGCSDQGGRPPGRRRGRVLGSPSASPPPCSWSAHLRRPHENFDTDFTVRMNATPAAPGASAVLDVGEIDDSGNWPLHLNVQGLPEQPDGRTTSLYLTRNGKPAASCGTFPCSRARPRCDSTRHTASACTPAG